MSASTCNLYRIDHTVEVTTPTGSQMGLAPRTVVVTHPASGGVDMELRRGGRTNIDDVWRHAMPLGSKEGLDTRIRRRNLGRGGSSRLKLASSWAKGLLSGTVDGIVGDPQVGSVLEGGVGEVSGVFGKRDRDRMSCYVVLCGRDVKSLEPDV